MIFHEKTQKPFKIKMHKWGRDDEDYNPMMNDDLYNYLIRQDNFKNALFGTINDFYYFHVKPCYDQYEKVRGRLLNTIHSKNIMGNREGPQIISMDKTINNYKKILDNYLSLAKSYYTKLEKIKKFYGVENDVYDICFEYLNAMLQDDGRSN